MAPPSNADRGVIRARFGIVFDQISPDTRAEWKGKLSTFSKDSPNFSDECSLCLEKYTKEKDFVLFLECAHNFCKDCIREWFGSNSCATRASCPLCRVTVTEVVIGSSIPRILREIKSGWPNNRTCICNLPRVSNRSQPSTPSNRHQSSRTSNITCSNSHNMPPFNIGNRTSPSSSLLRPFIRTDHTGNHSSPNITLVRPISRRNPIDKTIIVPCRR